MKIPPHFKHHRLEKELGALNQENMVAKKLWLRGTLKYCQLQGIFGQIISTTRWCSLLKMGKQLKLSCLTLLQTKIYMILPKWNLTKCYCNKEQATKHKCRKAIQVTASSCFGGTRATFFWHVSSHRMWLKFLFTCSCMPFIFLSVGAST